MKGTGARQEREGERGWARLEPACNQEESLPNIVPPHANSHLSFFFDPLPFPVPLFFTGSSSVSLRAVLS